MGSRRWAPSRRQGQLAVGLLVSVVLHAALYLAMHRAAFSPPVLEFQLPSEVEFGIVDGDGMPAPAPAPPPPPPPAEAPKARVEKAEPAPVETVSTEAPLIDAGTPEPEDERPVSDAGVPDVEDEGSESDALVAARDAGVFDPDSMAEDVHGQGDTLGATGEGFGVGEGGTGMGGLAPPGAAIGLHINMSRVRTSSLRLEAEALLGIIPEWEKLLKGSGLDPMRKGVIRRVFVATPDLKRANLVVGVRFGGKARRIERAVERLARAKGAAPAWRTEQGYRVAEWHNRGPTRRVLSFVADDHFTITRPVDLPRVLAVARALGRRQAKDGMRERSGGNRALLDMFDDEAVALSIEDARRFVVDAPTGIPKSLRVSVFSIDEFHARLLVRARYDSPKQAGAALDYLDGLRGQLVDHPEVDRLGLETAVEGAKLDRKAHIATLDMTLTLHQLRYLVQHLTAALAPSRLRD